MKWAMLVLKIIGGIIWVFLVFVFALVVGIFKSVFGFVETTGREGRAESDNLDDNHLP